MRLGGSLEMMVFNGISTICQLYRGQGRSQNNEEAQSVSTRGLRPLNGVYGAKHPKVHELYNRKGDVFDNFGSNFNNIKFRLFCPFLTMPLYGLTRTLTSLTTQTDLPRTNGWSRYFMPFETLMPKGITKYMSDRGYSLNF